MLAPQRVFQPIAPGHGLAQHTTARASALLGIVGRIGVRIIRLLANDLPVYDERAVHTTAAAAEVAGARHPFSLIRHRGHGSPLLPVFA